jgi:hypothetical protein
VDTNKPELKAYLLGTLEAERRTQLEDEILSDSDTYEELLVNEQELIEQYLTGGLTRPEQQQFENHFLITAERQKNLRFSRLFQDYLISEPRLASAQKVPVAVREEGETSTEKRAFAFSLPFLRQIPALVLSVGILLCLGMGLLWRLTLREPAAAGPNVQRFIVVTLAPGSMRSAGTTQRVKIPPDGVDLKLELEVTNTTFKKYKSQLFRENNPLRTTPGLRIEPKGEQRVVPVTIPGEMLSPGDYRVRLSGILDSGRDEFIDNYSFRVITD